VLLPFHTLRTAQPLDVRSEPHRADGASTYKWTAPKKPLTGSAKAVTTIGPFEPTTKLMVRPGRALARFGSVSVPPGNSAEFHIARHWAWVRYFWAFAAPKHNATLRLSQPASELTHNRRQTLSEDLGIALGLEVAERYLCMNQPPGTTVRAVDVDAVLSTGTAGHHVKPAHGTSMRPDYFLIRDIPDGASQLFVLECKGSHGKVGLDALHKASFQVQGLVTAPKATPHGSAAWSAPTGLISGTTLGGQEISVELFDPEGGAEWDAPIAPRAARGAEPVAKVDDAGTVRVHLEEMGRFRRLIRDVDDIRLLTVAGRRGAAMQLEAQWGHHDVSGSSTASAPLRIGELGDFDGSFLRMPLAGRAGIEVFLGVDRQIAEAIERDDDQKRSRAYASWSQRLPSGSDAAAEAGDDESITIALDDGVVMHARGFLGEGEDDTPKPSQ
jgi:hypothetical protein